MHHEFARVVREAMEAVLYIDEKDNERLKAAVEDLSNDFPQEKKFFQKNADDQFLKICQNAVAGEALYVYKKQAAEYLQKESWIDKDQADEMADIIVEAFALYGNNERSGFEQKKSDSINPIKEVSHSDSKAENETADLQSKEQREQDQNPEPIGRTIEPQGAPKKSKAKSIIIGIGVLLAIVIAIAIVLSTNNVEDYGTYDDSGSVEEVYDEEASEEDSINYKRVSHFGISYEIPDYWTEEEDMTDDYSRYYQFGEDDVFCDVTKSVGRSGPDYDYAYYEREAEVSIAKEDRNAKHVYMGQNDLGNGLTYMWCEAEYSGEDNTLIEAVESSTEYHAFIGDYGEGVTIEITYARDNEDTVEKARSIANHIKDSIKADE